VPRRNLVPLALLAVLVVLTAVFAVLGTASAPSGATTTVQNASGRTFGPDVTTSFVMNLVDSPPATGANAGSQVRQVRYVPPSRMAVYQVGSSNSLLAVLSPAAVACALSEYGAIVGGSTPWTTSGGAFVRTESLADYSARIPSVTATSSCAPSPTTAQGQVREKVVVRGGYLVGVRLTVVVPPQRLANGTPVAHGTQGDALIVTRINGTPTRTLGS
jgi:hypothetical protein